MSKVTFDVVLNGRCYPLHRDPGQVHPPELHHHLGTDTTTRGPETAIRRLLDAVEAADWFDEHGAYIGRNEFGIGIAGRDAVQPVEYAPTPAEVEILAAFDARFGTRGPEGNSDSEGRGAGCDDCAVSVDVREEHRAFVVDVVRRLMDAVR